MYLTETAIQNSYLSLAYSTTYNYTSDCKSILSRDDLNFDTRVNCDARDICNYEARENHDASVVVKKERCYSNNEADYEDDNEGFGNIGKCCSDSCCFALVVRKPTRLDGPVKTGQGCAKADQLTDRPSENRPLVVRKPTRLDGPVKTGQGWAKADRLTDRPSENRPLAVRKPIRLDGPVKTGQGVVSTALSVTHVEVVRLNGKKHIPSRRPNKKKF
ncbi:hypothetical protein HELRODRAFT_174264 [Helobdella robusta]|uniref:Uncharacterized protein n=1 Tax=Helobdella robusta TaxID=6412 RepID=T1F7W6_HELRO|nr:hypothetical protein HELRODRAFT_174264 [Helobdella robusta]ESO02835.1 hypothetical protein HELRODRAFT_174264 [Helobdella robusta]